MMGDNLLLEFVDITRDYGENGNPDYSDIKVTRFLCQTNIEAPPTTLGYGETLIQYHQYLKTGGSPSVYDNKTLSAGSIYIPFVNVPINLGDTWETLSVYSEPTDYLPLASRIPFPFPPSLFGLSGDTYPNDVYGLGYEVYVDTAPLTLANVTDEIQYIVFGNGTAIWDGNTYREGEVFIASNNNAVVFTGSAVMKQLSASRHKFYTVIWEQQLDFYNYILDNLDQCCDADLFLLYKIDVEQSALLFANYTQNISINKAKKTMNWINEKITQIVNV